VIAGQRLSYGTYPERLRALPTGECLAPEAGQYTRPAVPYRPRRTGPAASDIGWFTSIQRLPVIGQFTDISGLSSICQSPGINGPAVNLKGFAT
jgi:hypothetical protein